MFGAPEEKRGHDVQKTQVEIETKFSFQHKLPLDCDPHLPKITTGHTELSRW